MGHPSAEKPAGTSRPPTKATALFLPVGTTAWRERLLATLTAHTVEHQHGSERNQLATSSPVPITTGSTADCRTRNCQTLWTKRQDPWAALVREISKELAATLSQLFPCSRLLPVTNKVCVESPQLPFCSSHICGGFSDTGGQTSRQVHPKSVFCFAAAQHKGT